MNYAYVNGILLDGTKDMKPVGGKVILTEGDKIVAIRDSGFDTKGYEVVDLCSAYIMPGLINMHVHLAGSGKPPKKQKDAAKTVEMLFSNPVTARIAHTLVGKFAATELYSGVTTIRTVGGLRDLDTRVRDEIESGKRTGPRILAANEGISVPGGHMAGSVAIAAKDPLEAVSLVDKAYMEHTDLIKLMITGGVLDAKEKGVPGELKMSGEIIKAACDRAHELGMYVAAHCESPEGVVKALENGVDSIEHGGEPDEYMMKLFKEKNAYLTTTISPALPFALFDRSVSNTTEVQQYNGKVVFDGIVHCSEAALKNGIPVALGNDVGCPWITQYDFWRELYWFRKYTGVSNAFALYSATLNNARLAGIGDLTGSIEEGKCADLIVTKENPLEDLSALRHVTMVMSHGKLIRNADKKYKRFEVVDRQLDSFM